MDCRGVRGVEDQAALAAIRGVTVVLLDITDESHIAALPLLRQSRGRIIFISSTNGRTAAPLIGAYGASKFASEAAADSLRMELKPWHIAGTAVSPALNPVFNTAIAPVGGQITNSLNNSAGPLANGLSSGVQKQAKVSGKAVSTLATDGCQFGPGRITLCP